LKAVVDTNVLVSALMNANGPPAMILSLILNGKLALLYDNRIIFEYIEVLSRKEFGFNNETINDLMDFLKHEGEYINANPSNMEFHDESDKKFYEVHKSGEAQYLITGNKKHFPEEEGIIAPRDFLRISRWYGTPVVPECLS
jgi:putative PIN family toxin of toxin-antitoxin system